MSSLQIFKNQFETSTPKRCLWPSSLRDLFCSFSLFKHFLLSALLDRLKHIFLKLRPLWGLRTLPGSCREAYRQETIIGLELEKRSKQIIEGPVQKLKRLRGRESREMLRNGETGDDIEEREEKWRGESRIGLLTSWFDYSARDYSHFKLVLVFATLSHTVSVFSSPCRLCSCIFLLPVDSSKAL